MMPATRRLLLAVLLAWLTVAATVHLETARAQTRNPLAGTWALVSTIVTMPDGTTRPDPQVGPTPKGYMIYGDANRMCAQFTNPARPPWRSTTQPTVEELRSMIDFMGAYCARYEVNVAENYVLHHVEIDRVPNFSNQVRRRNFRFEGPDRLVLTAVPPPDGMAALTITWQRVAK
jgi:hypothetical protein